MPGGVDERGIRGPQEFPETSWSIIIHARDPGAPEHAHHLRRLVELYWRPVYRVIRQTWKRSHEDARDLTQDFFAEIFFNRDLLNRYAPERGSFRALVRTAISHFMEDVTRESHRLKRGGAALQLVSLDDVWTEPTEPIQNADRMSPEQLFDLAWNEAVIAEALALLERKMQTEGRAIVFEVFRRYEIEEESKQKSYAELGRELSLTVPQVKHALIEARTAFRDVVTDVVRGYVDDPAQLALELRHLLRG